MAGFSGGALPVVTVTSNVLVNQYVNRLANDAVNTGLGVVLSPVLGADLSRVLGLSTASGTNQFADLVTGSVLGLGQQAVNDFIGNAIANSGIPGPLSGLLTDVSRLGVDALAGSLSGLFSSGSGGGGAAERAFPGAGNEPDAQYQGSAYAIGAGPDVVFSIRPATSTAQFDGLAQIADPATPTTVNAFELTGVDTGSNYDPKAINFDPKALDFSSLGGDAFQAKPEDYASIYTNVSGVEPKATGLNPDTYKSLTTGSNSGGWTFICAPADVGWDLSAQVNRVDIFGTNTPPLISGTKGMRNLNLSNSIVEGFSRGKAVEDKIIQLEQLMNFSLSPKGFVNVPVYYVTANNKKYGGADGGYFIIKDIKVKESLRDLSGKATRAVTDVSFAQVPEYQVDTGVDQASKPQTGAKSALAEVGQDFTTKAGQVGPGGKPVAGLGAPPAPRPGGVNSGGGTNRSTTSGRNFGATGNPQIIRYRVGDTIP
jgi:hypothetical protein